MIRDEELVIGIKRTQKNTGLTINRPKKSLYYLNAKRKYVKCVPSNLMAEEVHPVKIGSYQGIILDQRLN